MQHNCYQNCLPDTRSSLVRWVFPRNTRWNLVCSHQPLHPSLKRRGRVPFMDSKTIWMGSWWNPKRWVWLMVKKIWRCNLCLNTIYFLFLFILSAMGIAADSWVKSAQCARQGQGSENSRRFTWDTCRTQSTATMFKSHLIDPSCDHHVCAPVLAPFLDYR